MPTPFTPERTDARREVQTSPFPLSADDAFSKNIASRRRSPLTFFLLVFALSIPFALLGMLTGIQLLPGIPLSALGFACPVTAAAILAYRDDESAAVRALEWGALRAAILLEVVWAGWHIVAMVQAGQSLAWIAWGCLDMVGTRVLMGWLYNNTGRSVFAVALYHAMANVSTKGVFPGGS